MKEKIAVVLLLLLCTLGCKDSQIQEFRSLGSKHRITMFGCDGKVIASWESTGNVSNQAQSDGWYFKDAKTGLLVEVTGNLVIEQEP